jgi:hypothetical protein
MAVAAGTGHREQNIGEWQPCYSFITLDSIEPDNVCYEDDSEEDTRGVRTLQNLRGYSIKSAIFTFAAAWKMKTTTLAIGWTKSLQDTEHENDFKGSHFYAIIKRVGGDVSESDKQWLDSDNGDPGYQILKQEEITESVLQGKEEDNDVDDEESSSSCTKLSVIRNHMDNVISYIGASSDLEVHLRQFCSIIIKKQHVSGSNRRLIHFSSLHLQLVPRSRKCGSIHPLPYAFMA